MKKQRPKSKIIEFPKPSETPEDKRVRDIIESDLMHNVGPPNIKRIIRRLKRYDKND